MIFSKRSLNFLELYALCVDQKRAIGKNFQIKSLDMMTVRFSKVTDHVMLFTDVKVSNLGSICYNYPTQSISQLLNTCDDDDKIEFNDNAIKLNNKAEYKFESVQYDTFSEESTFSSIINSWEESPLSILKDITKIGSIKYFIGVEERLDSIATINQYFISSNRNNATACIKTENDIKDNFLIPKLAITIFNSLKIKEISILEKNNKYIFKIDDTFLVVRKPSDNIIPNIFEDRFKKYYDHATKTIIARTDFLGALKRINTFAKENINTRIFLTFKQDEILLESKDKNYAIERIKANVDKELIDHYVILSTGYLINSINIIDSEEIIIKALPDKKSIAISLWPKDSKDVFIIQNMLQYID